MIQAATRIFFFLLTGVATSGDKFEEPEASSSLLSETVTSVHSSLPGANSYLQRNLFQKHEENQRYFPITGEASVEQNGIFDGLKNETSLQKIFKTDLMFFFKEVKICRSSHSYMSDDVFKQKFYCFLLNELNGVPKKNSEENFRCNISKKTVYQLKDIQHLLEIFRRIFLLNSKNDSCKASQKQAVGSRVDAIGIENLKLKLGDEWIALKPKVSHLSHIYLGTSIYPILTEESWVIEKDYTSKSAASTKSFYPKKIGHNEKEIESQPQIKSATKIYQLLAPIHLQRSTTKKENEPRNSRSLHPVGSKSLTSKHNLEKKFSTPSAYSSNPTTVVNLEFFNPTIVVSDGGTESPIKNDEIPQDKYKDHSSFHRAMYSFYNSFVKFFKDKFNP